MYSVYSVFPSLEETQFVVFFTCTVLQHSTVTLERFTQRFAPAKILLQSRFLPSKVVFCAVTKIYSLGKLSNLHFICLVSVFKLVS